jgi:hypothetical protein
MQQLAASMYAHAAKSKNIKTDTFETFRKAEFVIFGRPDQKGTERRDCNAAS